MSASSGIYFLILYICTVIIVSVDVVSSQYFDEPVVAWTYSLPESGGISDRSIKKDNAVVISSDGSLLFVTADDGSLHIIEANNENHNTVIFEPDNVKGAYTECRCGVSLNEGSKNEQYAVYAVIDIPATDAATGDNTLGGVQSRVIAVNFDGTMRWSVDFEGVVSGTPVLGGDGDKIYVSKNNVDDEGGQVNGVINVILDNNGNPNITAELTSPRPSRANRPFGPLAVQTIANTDYVYFAESTDDGYASGGQQFVVTPSELYEENSGVGKESYSITIYSDWRQSSVVRPTVGNDGLFVSFVGAQSSVAAFREDSPLPDNSPFTLRWEGKTATSDRDPNQPLSNAATLSDDTNRLYINGISNDLVCLNARTGARVWRDTDSISTYALEPKLSETKDSVPMLFTIEEMSGNVRQHRALTGVRLWELDCAAISGIASCQDSVEAEFSISPNGNTLYYGDIFGNIVALQVAEFETLAPTGGLQSPTASPTEIAATSFPTQTGTIVAPNATSSPNVSATEAPTLSPTDAPTESQALDPTAQPTDEPTEETTVEPSPAPSRGSTEESTTEPTRAKTAEPTAAIFATERVDGGLVSKCNVEVGETTTTKVSFEYLLFLEPGSDTDEITTGIEDLVHMALSREYLTCDFERLRGRTRRYQLRRSLQVDIDIVSLSSNPADTRTEMCNQRVGETDCMTVNSAFTISTADDVEVTDDMINSELGPFLSGLSSEGGIIQSSNENILGVTYIGVGSIPEETTKTPRPPRPSPAPSTESTPTIATDAEKPTSTDGLSTTNSGPTSSSNSNVILLIVAIVIVSILLIAIAALVLGRQRKISRSKRKSTDEDIELQLDGGEIFDDEVNTIEKAVEGEGEKEEEALTLTPKSSTKKRKKKRNSQSNYFAAEELGTIDECSETSSVRSKTSNATPTPVDRGASPPNVHGEHSSVSNIEDYLILDEETDGRLFLEEKGVNPLSPDERTAETGDSTVNSGSGGSDSSGNASPGGGRSGLSDVNDESRSESSNNVDDDDLAPPSDTSAADEEQHALQLDVLNPGIPIYFDQHTNRGENNNSPPTTYRVTPVSSPAQSPTRHFGNISPIARTAPVHLPGLITQNIEDSGESSEEEILLPDILHQEDVASASLGRAASGGVNLEPRTFGSTTMTEIPRNQDLTSNQNTDDDDNKKEEALEDRNNGSSSMAIEIPHIINVTPPSSPRPGGGDEDSKEGIKMLDMTPVSAYDDNDDNHKNKYNDDSGTVDITMSPGNASLLSADTEKTSNMSLRSTPSSTKSKSISPKKKTRKSPTKKGSSVRQGNSLWKKKASTKSQPQGEKKGEEVDSWNSFLSALETAEEQFFNPKEVTKENNKNRKKNITNANEEEGEFITPPPRARRLV